MVEYGVALARLPVQTGTVCRPPAFS